MPTLSSKEIDKVHQQEGINEEMVNFDEEAVKLEDPTGVIDPIENDPKWFKKKQDSIPCFKFSWDGVYDLNGIKNLSEDW